jgi:hypothetical protein
MKPGKKEQDYIVKIVGSIHNSTGSEHEIQNRACIVRLMLL